MTVQFYGSVRWWANYFTLQNAFFQSVQIARVKWTLELNHHCRAVAVIGQEKKRKNVLEFPFTAAPKSLPDSI